MDVLKSEYTKLKKWFLKLKFEYNFSYTIGNVTVGFKIATVNTFLTVAQDLNWFI